MTSMFFLNNEQMDRSASTQTSMPLVNMKDWCLPIGSMYGIFTYIYHKHQLNVGKYTSPMDPMGYKNLTTVPFFFASTGLLRLR